jgi:hypothetical protein
MKEAKMKRSKMTKKRMTKRKRFHRTRKSEKSNRFHQRGGVRRYYDLPPAIPIHAFNRTMTISPDEKKLFYREDGDRYTLIGQREYDAIVKILNESRRNSNR